MTTAEIAERERAMKLSVPGGACERHSLFRLSTTPVRRLTLLAAVNAPDLLPLPSRMRDLPDLGAQVGGNP